MTKKMPSYNPFKRKALAMAWEGWYGTWELVHWVLPLMYPKMPESKRRALAERTLRKFIEGGHVYLRRFHYTSEKYVDVPVGDKDAVLSNDASWQLGDTNAWQVRFITTPEGNKVCSGPPHTRGGWISLAWWVPGSCRARKPPTMTWTLRQLRRYFDRELSVYDFFWSAVPVDRYYRNQEDDPIDRIALFWRNVLSPCRSTIRRGDGDDERVFRGNVGLWLGALRMSKSEWREYVAGRKHPLNFWNLWSDEEWC